MRPFNPQAQVQAKSSAKITTDYSYTIKGDPSAPIGQFGGASREDVNFSFKVGQIVKGYLDNLGTNIVVQVGNYAVNIPKSNWVLVDTTVSPSNKYRFVDTFTDYAMHDFIFKKNDVIIGEPKNQSSYYTDIAGNVNVPAHILFTDFNTKNPFLKEIQIPLKYVVKVDDSTITTPLIQISQQPQNQQRRRTFYEMNQGYIFIGLGLVAGYFAYKKFKNT
jgi:hypothetical protein